MKKTIIVLSALFALVACNKETPVKESAIDPSKIVFNINVENAEATKGVKTVWEDGDDVYVFFEDNTTQYVKMTYDGSSWTYKDKDGGNAFSGLTLATSGKKLSAVYMPDFVCSAAPTYVTDKWTFGDIRGYYQAAESVDYTVTSTSDITTLSATINLVAPSGISQIFIPTSEYAALGSGEEYVLSATRFIQFSFEGVAPGGAVTQGNMSNSFPLPAFAGTLNGETGLYFWGILEAAGTYNFDFQLVKQNAEKKYAISSYSKSKKDATVPARFAAKLTGLTDNGNFVYMSGIYWATGNLKSDGTIADPLEAGDYFMWGDVIAYDPANYSTVNHYSTSTKNIQGTDEDTAKMVSGNNNWMMPTKVQLDELYDSWLTWTNWKSGWTNIGSDKKGGYLIKSKTRGISLFLAAGGHYTNNGMLMDAGNAGFYWSSTPATELGNSYCYGLWFNGESINADYAYRQCGVQVRPILK